MSGEKLLATTAWKNAVREAIARRGTTVKQLEVLIGCGAASIAKLLGPGEQRSALVRPVSEALGIPLPVPLTDDEIEFILKLRELTEKDQSAIRDFVNRHDALKR